MTRPSAVVTSGGGILATMPTTAYSRVIGDETYHQLQIEIHSDRDAERVIDDLRALAIQVEIAQRRKQDATRAMAGNGAGR